MALDQFTQTMDEIRDLKGEVAFLKQKASDQSADLLRASREIGARDNRLAELADVEAENERLKSEVADLKAKASALQSKLDAAARDSDRNAEKVAAAESFAAALKAFS